MASFIVFSCGIAYGEAVFTKEKKKPTGQDLWAKGEVGGIKFGKLL